MPEYINFLADELTQLFLKSMIFTLKLFQNSVPKVFVNNEKLEDLHQTGA